MLSAFIAAAFAVATALRRRGFELRSPPPSRAATWISLMHLVQRRPRFASAAPFLCLIVAHLEWPDMPRVLIAGRASINHAGRRRGERLECGPMAEPPVAARTGRGVELAGAVVVAAAAFA